MLSESSCPICLRGYNGRSRKELMLCLSQHFVCLSCADEIAEKDSRCPFCKRGFNIEDVQPRRIAREPISAEELNALAKHRTNNQLKMGLLCPEKHSSGKFMEGAGGGFIKCSTCHYVICCLCCNHPHERICDSNGWIYDQQFKDCSICGSRKRSGKTCKKCFMRLCSQHK